jgi:hypothetical protein
LEVLVKLSNSQCQLKIKSGLSDLVKKETVPYYPPKNLANSSQIGVIDSISKYPGFQYLAEGFSSSLTSFVSETP